MKNKNKEVSDSFIEYCKLHPDERFWQALRNFVKVDFVYIVKHDEIFHVDIPTDTFYFKEKNK